MPPSALPSCYKPQVINVSQNTGSSADSLSSVPSSPSNLSAAGSLDNLSGSFSELSVVSTSGAEGATGLETKEGKFCYWYGVSWFSQVYDSLRTSSSYQYSVRHKMENLFTSDADVSLWQCFRYSNDSFNTHPWFFEPYTSCVINSQVKRDVKNGHFSC